MKTINFNLKTVNEFTNEIFIKEFNEAIKKVVEGKAEIHLEVSKNKKVFCISCNDGKTIYINRNITKVKNFYGSIRKSYKKTSWNVIGELSGICKGFIKEAV